MVKAVTDLIKVKTIVTLVLTGVFAYLAVTGRVPEADFAEIFTMLMIFYYGTQNGKREKEVQEQAKEGEDNA